MLLLSTMVRHKENIGSRIKDARVSAGLSQADLAERLGLSDSQMISSYERGAAWPPLPRLVKIAEITKRPLLWFFLEVTGVTLDFPAAQYEKFWESVCQLEFEHFVAPYYEIQVPTSHQIQLANQEKIEGHDVDYARMVVNRYDSAFENHYFGQDNNSERFHEPHRELYWPIQTDSSSKISDRAGDPAEDSVAAKLDALQSQLDALRAEILPIKVSMPRLKEGVEPEIQDGKNPNMTMMPSGPEIWDVSKRSSGRIQRLKSQHNDREKTSSDPRAFSPPAGGSHDDALSDDAPGAEREKIKMDRTQWNKRKGSKTSEEGASESQGSQS